MNGELKLCPYCGVTPEKIYSGEEWYAKCQNDECFNKLYFKLASWNMRPVEDELSAEIGQLEQQNYNLRILVSKYQDVNND